MLQKEVFLGQSRDKLLEKRQAPEFVEKAKSAYKNCTTYLVKKMPINNSMLRPFCHRPQAQGNEITPRYLKRFPQLISNVLNKEEEQKFGRGEFTPIMYIINILQPLRSMAKQKESTNGGWKCKDWISIQIHVRSFLCF